MPRTYVAGEKRARPGAAGLGCATPGCGRMESSSWSKDGRCAGCRKKASARPPPLGDRTNRVAGAAAAGVAAADATTYFRVLADGTHVAVGRCDLSPFGAAVPLECEAVAVEPPEPLGPPQPPVEPQPEPQPEPQLQPEQPAEPAPPRVPRPPRLRRPPASRPPASPTSPSHRRIASRSSRAASEPRSGPPAALATSASSSSKPARAAEDALRVERALTEQLLRAAVASAFNGRESCSVATMQRCVGGELTQALLNRLAEADLALIQFGRRHSTSASAARDPRARLSNLNYEEPPKKKQSKAEAEEACGESESDASE